MFTFVIFSICWNSEKDPSALVIIQQENNPLSLELCSAARPSKGATLTNPTIFKRIWWYHKETENEGKIPLNWKTKRALVYDMVPYSLSLKFYSHLHGFLLLEWTSQIRHVRHALEILIWHEIKTRLKMYTKQLRAKSSSFAKANISFYIHLAVSWGWVITFNLQADL